MARFIRRWLGLLWKDKFAFAAAVVLVVVALCAAFGPVLLGHEATAMNLKMRNAPPFSLDRGWLFVLGADTLGRSLLARVVVATQNTMVIAGVSLILALVIGTALGVIAGMRDGRVSEFIMRAADVIMSFPSLLLALVVLYILQPSIANIIAILVIARVPVFLRTVRAETLEIRERMFVLAAKALGASQRRVVFEHVLPVLFPTIITLATVELSALMLSEAGLSFLGLGVQRPQITWGLMVSDGKNYLASAWWLAFWPGVAIMLTTISLALLSNWLSVVADPRQRTRMEQADKLSPVEMARATE